MRIVGVIRSMKYDVWVLKWCMAKVKKIFALSRRPDPVHNTRSVHPVYYGHLYKQHNMINTTAPDV